MDDYSIILPVSEAFDVGSEIIFVEKDSDKYLRDHLESFARYFKKEFKYDYIQYEANEHLFESTKYSGFLFSEMARDKLEEDKETPYRLYGGGCFRWQTFENGSSKWKLDWIWLHPFFRHRRKLSKQWQTFKEKYGSFDIEKPLSADMERFVKKHT